MRPAALALAIALAAAACGRKPDGLAVCQRAKDRYQACMVETLGSAANELLARAPDGVAACTRDDKTIAMYRACLPIDACKPFLACLMSQAGAGGPTIDADAPRAKQCEQHVQAGLRAIAAQAVLTGDRADDDKRRAQQCVLDESHPWDACLDGAERAEVAAYAAQRHEDCVAWSPALAACVLHLPGAHDCKPDDEPIWRLPIALGAPGPAIAWRVDVADDGEHEPRLAWAGRNLIVADAHGVRALRDGAPVWHAAAPSTRFALAGAEIAIDGPGGHGLAFLDAATGAARGGALADATLSGFAAAGDRVLALTLDGALVRIDPAACARRGARAAACATTIATAETDDVSDDPAITTVGDAVAIASPHGVRVYDPRGLRARVAFVSDDVDQVVALGDGRVGVSDDSGVAVLALDRCDGTARYLPSAAPLPVARAPDDCDGCTVVDDACVETRRAIAHASWLTPVALPGGAIAFNDHALIESTQLAGGGGPGWTVKTGGHGLVAGDIGEIFTVSFGQDSEGPVRLVALSRADGRPRWQTELPGATPKVDQYSDVAVVLGPELLAARVGPAVYVVPR